MKFLCADAFDAGDAGPIGLLQEGRLRRYRAWPSGKALGLELLHEDASLWPRVAIVTSHAGADGRWIDAWVAAGAEGIVVAGTGNGTVHAALQDALACAQRQGVRVVRVSRCAYGGIVGETEEALPALPTLSAVQARIELMLSLLTERLQAGR